MLEDQKAFVVNVEPIRFNTPSLQYEMNPELGRIVIGLINSLEGDNNWKKEQMYKLFSSLIEEISANVCLTLDTKQKATFEHYDSKKFLATRDLFTNLIQINENINRVQDSLNLLRYHKYDKPSSYASAMIEDFRRVTHCLMNLNNFIYSLIYSDNPALQVNPLKVLDFITQTDSVLTNFDENYILLPSEYRPKGLEIGVLLDEKTYTEVFIPSERESDHLKEVLYTQTRKTFDRIKPLFSVEALVKLINWDEINYCLDNNHDTIINQSVDHSQDTTSAPESPLMRTLILSVDKLSIVSPDDSSTLQQARMYILHKLKNYMEKIYIDFQYQIKVNQYKKISNLDEYIKKIVLEYSSDNKNYAEKALRIISDDMVNYFFNKRITVNPLLGKIEGIEPYFQPDLVDFRLLEHDTIASSGMDSFMIEFFNKCAKDREGVISRKVPKRYLCLVTRTKVDFFLIEYDYLLVKEGIKIFMTNPKLEGAFYQIFPKITAAMPTQIKRTFSVYNIEFLEPRFNLDYKQVWLNYFASSATSNIITDLFQLLVYATIFTLHNHKQQRPDKLIQIDCKYFFNFVDNYLDFQECYRHPSPEIWKENFPLCVVPFPFSRPFLRKGTEEMIEPGPKAVVDVSFVGLFEQTLTWRVVKDEQRKEMIKKLTTCEILNFDSPRFVEDFLNHHFDRKETVEIIKPEVSNTIWKHVKSQVDNFEPAELPSYTPTHSKDQICFLMFSSDMYNPLLALAVNHKAKSIIYLLKDSSKDTLWSQNHADTFKKCLGNLFSRELNEYSTAQIRCSFASTDAETVFGRFCFPTIHLLRLIVNNSGPDVTDLNSITITDADTVAAFEKFMYLNLFSINPEVYRAYYIFYQGILRSEYSFAISVGNWKLRDFVKTLQYVEKKLATGVSNVLLAFGFTGIRGNSTYYLAFSLRELSPQEDTEPKPVESNLHTYDVEIFSLDANKIEEDTELIKEVINYSKYCQTVNLVCSKAYKINSKANILLTSRYEETLMSIAYLRESSNMSTVQAFKTLSMSSLAHYREINHLISHVNLRTKFDSITDSFKDTLFDTEIKDINPDEEEAENIKQVEKRRHSLRNTIVTDGFIHNKQAEEKTNENINTSVLNELQGGDLKLKYYNTVEKYVDELNRNILKTSTFNFVWGKDALSDVLLHEEFESKLDSVCNSLVGALFDAMKAKAPLNLVTTTNTCKIKLYISIPPEAYEQFKQLQLITYQSHTEVPFKLYYIRNENSEEELPASNERLESFFAKLKDALNAKFNTSDSSASQVISFSVDEPFEKMVLQSYYLCLLNLMHSIVNTPYNKESDNSLALYHTNFLKLLNKDAHFIFSEELLQGGLRKKYNEIIQAFCRPSNFTKTPCLMSFPLVYIKMDSINILKDGILGLKNQFIANSNLSNYIFGFNIVFKNTLKHYTTFWKCEEGDSITLTIFTNSESESNVIVDKLVLSYILEDFSEFDMRFNIKKLHFHRGSIKHSTLYSFTDITTYLMAHLTCFKMIPPQEAFTLLSSSALLYVKEFNEFDEKCKSL